MAGALCAAVCKHTTRLVGGSSCTCVLSIKRAGAGASMRVGAEGLGSCGLSRRLSDSGISTGQGRSAC